MRTISAFLAIGLCNFSIASAQDWTTMSTPYGQNAGDETRPMRVASRDSNGTRIVVNGRIIDAGEPNAAPRSFVHQRSPRSSLNAGGTLRQTTLNAMAVGNNVEINGVTNSIITINQTNNGIQTANAVGY